MSFRLLYIHIRDGMILTLYVLCSVTRKMTQKYGEFTNDPAFQKKKWWQNIPGLG